MSKDKVEAKPSLEELKRSLEVAEAARDEEMDKDWPRYAANVMDKFFDTYSKVKGFLDRCTKQMEDRYWVISPLGRRRTMYRGLTGIPKFRADAGRRAQNSPIQGISSETGVTAGYLILQHIDRYMHTFGIDKKYFSLYCRAVHDATYLEEAYCMVLAGVHINQYVATIGVTDYYDEVFGFRFNLSPEIELSFGADSENSISWDWDISKLPGIFKTVLENLAEQGRIDKESINKKLKVMLGPWIEKEKREWLQKHYPLMGVCDLDDQICAAITAAGFTPER